jgi:hypothetical protein
MSCTSVTKQSNGQALPDRPSDPNLWYIGPGYPRTRTPNPLSRIIRTARMIPLDLVNPLVGMAGITAAEERYDRAAGGQSTRNQLSAGPTRRACALRDIRSAPRAPALLPSRPGRAFSAWPGVRRHRRPGMSMMRTCCLVRTVEPSDTTHRSHLAGPSASK